jgi:hypothetical protein
LENAQFLLKITEKLHYGPTHQKCDQKSMKIEVFYPELDQIITLRVSFQANEQVYS